MSPETRASQPNRPDCPYCANPLLVRDGACAACRAELSRACPSCAGPTPAPRPQPAAELRPMTVLFRDRVGSTTLASALAPEESASVIAAFHQQVTEQMARHGGFVARCMGDGALVYFGLPRAREDDAERAVRAVRAAIAAIELVGAIRHPVLDRIGRGRPRARIGIAGGLALVGDMIGVGQARGLDVAGEAPNLAARLRTLAEPGTILVSHAVRRQVGNLFEFRALGPHSLKGWAEPVRVWRALRAARHASRFETRLDQALSPLFGRDPALARLMTLWGRTCAGRGQMVLISGEAGIGKSRLVEEMLARIDGDAAAAPHARRRCFRAPDQAAVPLYPFIQQIERAIGAADDDPPATRLDKLRAALAGTPAEDVALIATLLLPDHPPAADGLALAQLTPPKRRRRTQSALLRQALSIAAEQPLLAVLEDARWSDPTSRELLALAARTVAEHPMMLVVTTRPDDVPDWAARPGVAHLTLEALPAADCARLARAVDAESLLPADVIAAVVSRADGVPLYVEEVTRAVLEAGTGSGRAPVPPSIHAGLHARLDRLGEARETAEIAATIGREFSLTLLARVCGRPDRQRGALVAARRVAVAGALVHRRGGGAASRRADADRDAARQPVAAAGRSDMAPAHRLSRALLALGEARGEPASIAAGCYARGMTGFGLGAFDRARALLGRGVALLEGGEARPADIPTVGDARVVVRATQPWALLCLGRVAEAEAACDAAVATARRLGQGFAHAFALNDRA